MVASSSRLLQEFARLLKSSCRVVDLVARVLPTLTPLPPSLRKVADFTPARRARVGERTIVAALFLCVEKIAADGERRPARSNRMSPHLHGRFCRPVRIDTHAANDSISSWTTKPRPLCPSLSHSFLRSFW